MMLGSQVVLAMPKSFGIYKCIIDSFLFMGYQCNYVEPPTKDDIKCKSLFFKFKLLFRIYILNSKRYKKRYFDGYSTLETMAYIDELLLKSNKLLIIRPDLYPKEVLEKLNKGIHHKVVYQWDGLNRFPRVFDLICMFKKFYVFDKRDLGNYKNVCWTTNFYFDCYLSQQIKEPEYDFYYLGTFDERIEDLLCLCLKLFALNLKMKIVIHDKYGQFSKRYPSYDFITVTREAISYLENLKLVFNSKLILDFAHSTDIHRGLSFRPFEALGYSKKLITTNQHIIEYDFYCEDNILIYNSDVCVQELSAFVSKPYLPIDDSLREKYSFTNWYKRLV